MQKFVRRSIPFFLLLFIIAFSSCSLTVEDEPASTEISGVTTDLPVVDAPILPTETIVHLVLPGSGASTQSSIADTISGDTARQGVSNEPPGGDMYIYNLYERPFNALTQDIFFPDLDIRSADLGLNGDWMYVTIYLYGVRQETGQLAGHYGIELDLNIDGRGDWLIMADTPLTTEWTTIGVRAWNDTNTDVAQQLICYADPPQTSDSYDLLYFDQGIGEDPDAAWARVVESTPPSVQIAFKHTMINADLKFMWGVWTDQGVFQPQWFDYHDHFTYEEAGAPFSALPEYPIKAIAELDNTCRWVYGFTPTGSEPCLCAGNVPTPTPVPASLGGYVYKDVNGNSHFDMGEGLTFADFKVATRNGPCPGGSTWWYSPVDRYGRYTLEGLAPGTYCVQTPSFGVFNFSPLNYEVTLSPGEFRDGLNFDLDD